MGRPLRPPRRAHDFGFFRVRWLARYGWIVDRRDAVVVVPIAPDGRVWLAEIHRPPIGGATWEVPGGAVDPGETPIEAALRELAEECALVATGAARELRHTQELAPGMGTFPHRVVVAEGVVPRGRRAVGQADEGIGRVRRFDVPRARKMIEDGRVRVPATIGALAACGWLWGEPR